MSDQIIIDWLITLISNLNNSNTNTLKSNLVNTIKLYISLAKH